MAWSRSLPTVPTFAGAVAVIVVGESTETWDDSFGPKYTALAFVESAPGDEDGRSAAG